MTTIMELCNQVRQTAFEIHKYLKNGHMEKVSENALFHRLQKMGLDVERQRPIRVYDEEGFLLGDYVADLWLQGRLLIELKAAKFIVDEHVAQMLGYQRASRIEHGLLINFGGPKFEIRKYILSPSGHSKTQIEHL